MRVLNVLLGAWMALPWSTPAPAATTTSAPESDTAPYLRWPAVRDDILVFAAEGDLWRASLQQARTSAGAVAHRLTTHAAEESMPALSADGQWLGFVASYDTGPEVYAMPLSGGTPRRLSYDGGRVLVQGFDTQGRLLYSTDAVPGPSWSRRLRSVDPVTGTTTDWPLADATEGVLDPAGDALWFVRFGLQVTTDNARQYRGGAMAQLWRAELPVQAEARRIATPYPGNLRRPQRWGERLLVIGDAQGLDNLWSLALDGTDPQPLTQHSDWPVRSLSTDGVHVVYALGAELRALDATGHSQPLTVHLPGDREASRTRVVRKPLNYLSGAALAPNGQRVALSLRGQLQVAGTGTLRRALLDGGKDARLRSPAFSPDGRTLYAVRDQGAYSRIVALPADGSGSARVVGPDPDPTDADVHLWQVFPAADARWLASTDKRGRLWLHDLQANTRRLLDQARYGSDQPYRDVVWSADSRWLVVTRPDTTLQRGQLVLLARDGQTLPQVLTSDRYPSYAPAYSPDGRWLYFLSERQFATQPGSPWGDRNTGPYYDRRTRVYALALQATPPRFPFQAIDELNAQVAASANETPTEAVPGLDMEGLAGRLYEVPLVPGNYEALAVDAQRLYLLDRDAAPNARPALKTVTIAEGPAEAVVFSTDVAVFALSADRKRLYLQKIGADNSPSELLLLDAAAKPPEALAKAQVKIPDHAVQIDPRLEWRQMFDDAWRMHAAFAFDARLRGVDWDAARAQYAPLVERVGDRSELDDLLAMMIAEVGLLHSQVRQSELRVDPDNGQDSYLGAEWRETDAGLELATVWRTEAELPSERGPLQTPGLDVSAGDRLQTVNGRSVQTRAELSAALRNQAGQAVLLDWRRGAGREPRGWQTLSTPVNAEREATLRYGHWVQSTRAQVEQAGAGRIGYLHLRAMGAADMAQFVREFYAQFDRDGLIIDVRRNRGGNIDSWVIEKLLRRTWAYWHPPGREPYWNMPQTFRGHLVVLTDALTYSDGETFAAGVQALGLGPVIGQRTAGAGIWLSDRNRLADNGVARIAEFGQFDRHGRWLIEGQGVAPDQAVDNLPWASASGQDAQLSAALDTLQRRLTEQPLPRPSTETIPPVGQNGAERAQPVSSD